MSLNHKRRGTAKQEETEQEDLDQLLKKINNKKNCKINFGNFCKELQSIEADSERGEGVDFSADRKKGAVELGFRDKACLLRTLPLEKDLCFIALCDEAGFYRKNKRGRYSADLLGLWRNRKTTKLAVVELKAGRNGDSLLYAVAEGLRNLYIAWLSLKRLENRWEKTCPKKTKESWGESTPFQKLAKKKAQLVIIGDHSWAKKTQQKEDKKIIKRKPITIGKLEIEVSIYSFANGAKSRSKPYALLPLRKI